MWNSETRADIQSAVQDMHASARQELGFADVFPLVKTRLYLQFIFIYNMLSHARVIYH